MIKKDILKNEETGELYIQFTDEDLKELELNLGDVFEVSERDGAIVLKRTQVSVPIELSEYSREDLEKIIIYCSEHNLTIQEFVVKGLEDFIKNHEHLRNSK